MLDLLEQQKKLTINQWKIAGAATLGDMLDFFDFFLIGFVLAFIVKDWHLTYGQSGAILLASGISAPFGSLFYGWLADKVGRRTSLIAAILNVSLATGAMALTPTGAWMYLVVLPLYRRLWRDRAVFGRHHVDAGVLAGQQARLVYRLTTTMLPGGLAARGAARRLCRALYRLARPGRGRACCRRCCASTSGPSFPNRRIGCCARGGWKRRANRSPGRCRSIRRRSRCRPSCPPIEHTRWIELFKYPRSIIAGCLTGLTQTGGVALALWMVTLFVMVLKITPPEASKLVIWVSLSAIAGRFFCSWISDAWGAAPPASSAA